MDTAPHPAGRPQAARLESEAKRQRLIAQKAAVRYPDSAEGHHRRTLTALADVDAGRLIDDEAMQAWADSLGTDHELPVPQPG